MGNLKQTGFTLIELMMVLAIVGVVTAVAIPAYDEYTKEAADNACLSEAQGYAQAIAIAMSVNKAVFPIHVSSACNQIATPNANDTSLQATPSRTGTGVSITCDLTNNGLCTK